MGATREEGQLPDKYLLVKSSDPVSGIPDHLQNLKNQYK
jgi:hypothetical protein